MLNRQNGEHEVKYIIGNFSAKHVLDWLKNSCLPDPEYPAGIVSSIYYDSLNWSLLNEKINSDFHKTKIRARWYTGIEKDIHFPNCYIEAKFKFGSKREKVRVIAPCSGKWIANIRLEDPMLLSLPDLLRSKGVKPSEHLFPAYKITYKRYRFIDPITRCRVCFDSDIAAPEVNNMMLSKHFPFTIQTAVLEIKGGGNGMPLSLHPLIDLGFRKSSFSKYEACYRSITGSVC